MRSRMFYLVLGRHGKAQQKPEGGSVDALVPGAVGEIYEAAKTQLFSELLRKIVQLPGTFLRHTDKKRTMYSAQALLIGAFALPAEGEDSSYTPQTQEDLQKYGLLQFIDTAEDPRLGIGTVEPCNLNVYKDKERGAAACLNYALQHPEATQHEGVPIEPLTSLGPRTTAVVQSSLDTLVQGRKDLGVMISHATIIEHPVLALINTARQTPIIDINDIGGAFDMGEFAVLRVEQTDGGFYTAALERKGQKYDVHFS